MLFGFIFTSNQIRTQDDWVRSADTTFALCRPSHQKQTLTQAFLRIGSDVCWVVVTQWSVLNQVPRGGATPLIFRKKWMLRCGAWGETSLKSTELAKKNKAFKFFFFLFWHSRSLISASRRRCRRCVKACERNDPSCVTSTRWSSRRSDADETRASRQKRCKVRRRRRWFEPPPSGNRPVRALVVSLPNL